MSFLARFARTIVPLIAISALVLSGCGNKKAVTLEGKEGERLDLDGLVYQVQLSRILNVRDTEDEQYTRGQPAPSRAESYYGVFIRVDNEESDKPRLPVNVAAMKIVDAGGKEFKPIPITLPGMAYAPVALAKGARIPVPDSAADNNPEKGAVALFKLPYTSLDNRPLTLIVKGRDGETGEITLDV